MRSSTDIIKVAALLVIMSLLMACAGGRPPTCETEGFYQLSRSGQRIEVSGDLDDLQSYKEMTIPEVSPRQPLPDSDRCLEMPPEIFKDDAS
jgi:hypothetical protein